MRKAIPNRDVHSAPTVRHSTQVGVLGDLEHARGDGLRNEISIDAMVRAVRMDRCGSKLDI